MSYFELGMSQVLIVTVLLFCYLVFQMGKSSYYYIKGEDRPKSILYLFVAKTAGDKTLEPDLFSVIVFTCYIGFGLVHLLLWPFVLFVIAWIAITVGIKHYYDKKEDNGIRVQRED